jgi:hypothetical protein
MINVDLPHYKQIERRRSTIAPDLLTSGYRCMYVSHRAANLRMWCVLGSDTFEESVDRGRGR